MCIILIYLYFGSRYPEKNLYTFEDIHQQILKSNQIIFILKLQKIMNYFGANNQVYRV